MNFSEPFSFMKATGKFIIDAGDWESLSGGRIAAASTQNPDGPTQTTEKGWESWQEVNMEAV